MATTMALTTAPCVGRLKLVCPLAMGVVYVLRRYRALRQRWYDLGPPVPEPVATETYWVLRRMGRRIIIVMLGIVACFTGLNLIYSEQTAARLEALYAFRFLTNGSLAAWGGLWLVAGGIAMMGAFVPATNDRWGLDALSFMYAAWAFEQLLVGLVFDSNSAMLTGFRDAVVTTIVVVIANMRRVNPPKPAPHVHVE